MNEWKEIFNNYTFEELIKLDGIGRTVAKRIINKRPFMYAKQVETVKGLGRKTLEKYGVLEPRKKRSKNKIYIIDGVEVEAKSKALAIDTRFSTVDYFWRIPREYRQYIG